MKRLLETVYHVRDIDEAINHYTNKLGGKLVKRLPWGLAFVDLDGLGGIISLFSVDTYYLENPNVRDFPGPKVTVSVDDLDLVRTELIKQEVRVGTLLGEKGDIRGFEAFDPDGNAIFYLEDPNGVVSAKLRSS